MAITISDQNGLLDLLDVELNTLASKLEDDQKIQAAEKAVLELRWAFPITDSFKTYWTIERAKRHALYIMMTDSAHKFKYKQINLNQRFDHYYKLLEKMDEDFQRAIEENPNMFPGVDIGDTGMTDYIPSGFTYDFAGNDISEDTVDIAGDEE